MGESSKGSAKAALTASSAPKDAPNTIAAKAMERAPLIVSHLFAVMTGLIASPDAIRRPSTPFQPPLRTALRMHGRVGGEKTWIPATIPRIKSRYGHDAEEATEEAS